MDSVAPIVELLHGWKVESIDLGEEKSIGMSLYVVKPERGLPVASVSCTTRCRALSW